MAISPAWAASTRVAVAANFTAVAEELAARFEAQSGHEIALSFGATGQLYAQIWQGAPFDVLLSADVARTEQAIVDGLGVVGSDFVYALGRLVLYAPGREANAETLRGEFLKLAIADPLTAPYGKAAQEVIAALGLSGVVEGKLVQGETISQTLQFVESGNAELGFVALSQVMGKDSIWVVPEALHSPIAQGAVLLKQGADNEAAVAFLDYLRSDEAVAVMLAAGYAVP